MLRGREGTHWYRSSGRQNHFVHISEQYRICNHPGSVLNPLWRSGVLSVT